MDRRPEFDLQHCNITRFPLISQRERSHIE
jgi:hypothetical protein